MSFYATFEVNIEIIDVICKCLKHRFKQMTIEELIMLSLSPSLIVKMHPLINTFLFPRLHSDIIDR